MKRPIKTIAYSIFALSISAVSYAQDMHIPEKGMPGPVPVQTPEAVELKSQKTTAFRPLSTWPTTLFQS